MPLPSTPDQKPTLDMFGETVRVYVGEAHGQESFTIHKDFLSFYTGHFQDKLCTRLIDGIHLPDEDTDTFKHFQFWLYTHTYDRVCKQNLDRMVELWVFADEYRIPLLQNMVLDEIRDQVASKQVSPDTAQINFVYEHTVSNSGFRRFVIGMMCRRMSSKDVLNSDNPCLTKEALWDVVEYVWPMWESGMLKCPSQSNVEHWDMCRYHVHEDGVSCHKK